MTTNQNAYWETKGMLIEWPSIPKTTKTVAIQAEVLLGVILLGDESFIVFSSFHNNETRINIIAKF